MLDERSQERWRGFVDGREEQHSDPVVRAWSRSRQLHVDPRGPKRVDTIDTQGELVERRDRLDETWHVIRPMFSSLAQRLAELDFVTLLTDAEGVVVRRDGGGGFAELARQVRLMEGAHWSESARGTNAIGTALAERRPVSVLGCAHFEATNHGLVCHGHPLLDAQGDVLAVVDVTSSVQASNPLTELVVSMAAEGMQAALAEHSLSRRFAMQTLEALVRHLPEPAFVVGCPGVVVVANQAGEAWLRGAPSRLGLSWDELSAVASSGGVARVEVGGRSQRVMIDAVVGGDAPAYLVIVEPRRTAPPVRPARRREGAFARMRGSDPAFEQVVARANRFAPTEVPVLLLAETGTGKELMARAIHDASARKDGPFVALNCGALSPHLVASELFGYTGGAFTGALRKGSPGIIERADGGTLFLDEIGEMPPPLQAALLRVLDDGTYCRVGDGRVRRSNVRLVCATCRDLPKMVETGEFRRDLYYRVRGATLGLPPLRERSDVLELAEAFVEAFSPGAVLSESAEARIVAHAWPGNIRELRAAMQFAVVLAADAGRTVVLADDLPRDLHESMPREPVRAAAPAPSRAAPTSPPASLHDVEAVAVRDALDAVGGNRSAAARRLGVARSTLYRMMERHGLA